jgi:hypothetical protein
VHGRNSDIRPPACPSRHDRKNGSRQRRNLS